MNKRWSLTRHLFPVLISPLLVTLLACEKKKSSSELGPNVEPVAAQPIAAGRSGVGLIEVKVKVTSDALELDLEGIPEGSKLECFRGTIPLEPCHDKAQLKRPKPGDYAIGITAFKDGQTVAVGESALFTVVPAGDVTNSLDGESSNPLILTIDDDSFENGQTVDMTKGKSFKFKLVASDDRQLKDCTTSYRCSFGPMVSNFTNQCEGNQPAYTVTPAMMALGLQHLTIQATCGEEEGPKYLISWYGVPSNYENMMLYSTKDSQDNHLVQLVRAADCPDDKRFECAGAGATDYKLCQNGNRLTKPAQGSKIRLSCNGKKGPLLTF